MTSFAEIGVCPEIVLGLSGLGFEAPTPVQEKVIPALLEGPGDWVCLAQTGTGKTAAFGIPLLQTVDSNSRKTQALVLCPTRELCVQVARDLADFGRHLPAISTLAVYGGARIEQQITALKKGVQIIIATPGRLHDLMRRGAADISAIRVLVLDEADEMLNMGFKEEINAILAQTPAVRSTLLFSATMSQEVAAIANGYMTKPREITVGRRNSGADNVRHQYYMVRARDRYPALKRLLDSHPDIYGIIFCRTRQETQEVADKLSQDGYQAEALHGDLSQAQRDAVMAKFRRRNLQMLVATDVAARGVDVNDLTHVINYNLPDEISVYTHRSGRTGRAGKDGIAISIIHQKEGGRIRAIERNLKKVFERLPVPSGRDICEKQLLHRVRTLLDAELDHDLIEPLLPAIMENLAGVDRDELVKRFVAVEFKRFLDYYRNAPDLNVHESDNKKDVGRERSSGPGKEQKNSRRQDRDNASFVRFHVNVGSNDGITPVRLIAMVNAGSPGQKIAIGKIELTRNFSFLEADSRYADLVLRAFSRQVVNGKPVAVEIASGTGKRPPARMPKSFEPMKKRLVTAKRRKKQKRLG